MLRWRPRSGWRSCVSACRISRAKHRSSLKSRFGAETGEGRLPFPLPLTRRQPLSPARRRTAPLTQGSHKAAAAANGEETGGRCGVRRVSEANLEVVRFGEKHKETIGRCGVRRVSEANLEHERFGRKSTVCSDGGREAAEAGAFGGANKPGGTPAHRRWVGAESENKPCGTLECPKGTFQCGDC